MPVIDMNEPKTDTKAAPKRTRAKKSTPQPNNKTVKEPRATTVKKTIKANVKAAVTRKPLVIPLSDPSPRPRRRRATLTPDQKVEVETLARVLNQEQIADYFGIGYSTFKGMLAKDPELARRYKTGLSRAISTVAQGLLQDALAGDNTARIFFLKTRGRWSVPKEDNQATPHATPVPEDDGAPSVPPSKVVTAQDALAVYRALREAEGDAP